MHEDHRAIFDEDTRVARPPELPDHNYLQNMMVVVHFRSEFLKDSLNRDRINGWLIGIEQELNENKVYY